MRGKTKRRTGTDGLLHDLLNLPYDIFPILQPFHALEQENVIYDKIQLPSRVCPESSRPWKMHYLTLSWTLGTLTIHYQGIPTDLKCAGLRWSRSKITAKIKISVHVQIRQGIPDASCSDTVPKTEPELVILLSP